MDVTSANVVFSTLHFPCWSRCQQENGRSAPNSSASRPVGFGNRRQQVGHGQDEEEDDQEQEGQDHGAPPGGSPPRSAGFLWAASGSGMDRPSGSSLRQHGRVAAKTAASLRRCTPSLRRIAP